MAIDAVGDINRVTVAWTFPDGQVLENNTAWRCTIAGGSDTRLSLGSQVYGTFLAAYLPIMAANTSIYGYKVSSLNKVPPPAPIQIIAVAAGGDSGNNALPSQARPLLQWRTALSGPKYRGRLFLPPPSLTGIGATGFPATAVNNAINTVGSAMIVPILSSGSTWELVLAHLTTGSPLATTGTLVTSGISGRKFGTQWKSGNTGRPNAAPW